MSIRQPAAKCAENSATNGMDSGPLGSRRTCPSRQGAHRRPACHGMSRVIQGTMDLHEEGAQRMLEGGDRTVGLGEGGLEMCEDLRRRPVRGLSRQRGRRTLPSQCRADFALALVEPSPDALQGPVTEMAVGGADGCEYGVGGGALEEPPQTAGCQTEPADFVSAPDAEGPSATRACIAIAAKDPPCADRFSPGVVLVKSAQIAVPNQRADHLAMRTRRLLEPLSNRVRFVDAAEKPSLLTHADHASTKIVILPASERCWVEAGYDLEIIERGAG
jgi:hypothetical protein